jgi:pSer/pThr/pTyr-binding forkhead associated (FHA) protein
MNKATPKPLAKNKAYLSKDRTDGTIEKKAENPCQEKNRASAPFGVLLGTDNGHGFLIREEVFVIGRNYNCDLRIEKPYVSQVHAVISQENGSLILEDLGGRHGTWVNQVPVGRTVLVDGDRIHIGRAELVFKSGGIKGNLANLRLL